MEETHMIKKILAFSLTSLLLIGCAYGEEEPPDYTPLFALYDVNLVHGIHYSGLTQITKCEEDPLFQNCLQLQDAEKAMFTKRDQNFYLTQTVENNVVKGEFRLIIPHLNFLPDTFHGNLTGHNEEAGNGKKLLIFDNIYGVPGTETPENLIDLESIRLEMEINQMTGTMVVIIKQPESTNSVRLEYNINLKKEI